MCICERRPSKVVVCDPNISSDGFQDICHLHDSTARPGLCRFLDALAELQSLSVYTCLHYIMDDLKGHSLVLLPAPDRSLHKQYVQDLQGTRRFLRVLFRKLVHYQLGLWTLSSKTSNSLNCRKIQTLALAISTHFHHSLSTAPGPNLRSKLKKKQGQLGSWQLKTYPNLGCKYL